MKTTLISRHALYGLVSGLLLMAVGTTTAHAALYLTHSGGVKQFTNACASSDFVVYDPNEIEVDEFGEPVLYFDCQHDYETDDYICGEFPRAIRHDPYGIAVDIAGNVFVADWGTRNIDKYTPEGVHSVLFKNNQTPTALAFDSQGNLYASLDNTVRKFSPTGTDLGVFVVNPSSGGIGGLIFDSADNLYISNWRHGTITRFGPAGGAGTTYGTTATVGNGWYGLAFDGAGTLYATNWFSNQIVTYAPGGGSSVFFASTPRPSGLAFDRDGNLFVTRYNVGGQIHKFESTGGVLSNTYTVIASAIGHGLNFLAFDGDDFLPPCNTLPTANAGADQSIRAGATVNLDGGASFDDNTAAALLEYSWTFSSKPVGSTATLSNTNTATPSFEADVAGNYVVELVVTDEGSLASQPDTVGISSNNLAPTSFATVDHGLAIVGTTSNFDGTGSTDPETDPLTYSWSIAAAPGSSTATLLGANTASPTLTTDVEGTYEVTLTVSDFIGAGTLATIDVVATTPGDYAEIQIIDASDTVEALLPGQVTTGGNQNAFGNFLKNATKNIQKGNIDKAIADLNQAIERTDGCDLHGSPDGNGKGRDWITDCTAQTEAYNLLDEALNALLAP